MFVIDWLAYGPFSKKLRNNGEDILKKIFLILLIKMLYMYIGNYVKHQCATAKHHVMY